MGMKTQAATEYLMIVGFVIVILIPGIYLYMKYSQESQDSVINAKVDSITNEIVKAAEQVYTYGEGSQTTISIDLPKNIVAISFQNNEIVFTVINSKGQQSEIAKSANVNLIGEITLIQGIKKINIMSLGDVVSVYVECVDSTNRCGIEWECNRYIEGYQEGLGCVMTCENNKWKLNEQEVCTEGCDGGECIACEENDIRCGIPSLFECLPYEECTFICQGGDWQFNQQCVDQTPICVNDQCVSCQDGELKCGLGPECVGDIDQECVLSCENNMWNPIQQCVDPTPICEEEIGEVPTCSPRCNEGEQKCGVDDECDGGVGECKLECIGQQWIVTQCIPPQDICEYNPPIAECVDQGGPV